MFVFLPGMTVAQKQDTALVREIDEVTVSARNTMRPLMSAMPLQIMNGERIQALGLQNMADAVKRFSGTTVRDYGGIGGMKTVSVRSLGAHHTAVSYDDVAVSNCQAGQIDIGRFTLDQVSVLSLAVGEEDHLLHSARMAASAAVLSIRTEIPDFMNGRSRNLYATVRTGSFGQFNPVLGGAFRLKPETVLSGYANFMRADGVYPFTLINGAERTREKRYNSDIVSGHAEANLYHTLRAGATLHVKAYYFNSERGLPGSVVLYNNESRERLRDENFFVQAVYRKRFSDQWSLQGQVKYNYSWNRYEDTNVKYENGKQVDLNAQNEYYASAAVLYVPAEKLSFSLAQDGAVNTLRNNMPQGPHPVRYTSLTALRAKYTFNRLTLSATLLNTLVAEEVKTGDAPAGKKRLTPSFSVIYKPFGRYYFNMRVLCKKTFRVPAFNDLYYLRMGNTGLRPEKADEYNLGITWSGTPFPFTEYVTFTLDGFYNEVKDKIVAFPSTYVWRMANFGKVRIYGIDVNVSAGIPVAKEVSLSFAGSYTCQRAIDRTLPDAKNYKHQIPYTPLHGGNASVTAVTPWVNIGYTLMAAGERYSMKQNAAANRMKGYVEHTLSLARKFDLKRYRIHIQAECVNLTDKQYDIIKYYPMPGRSFRATVKLII
jgi:outer membrane cobalamin receptor